MRRQTPFGGVVLMGIDHLIADVFEWTSGFVSGLA